MDNVIVAFSKPEDAANIKRILVKNGFFVAGVCTSGAQAITEADSLGSGVLVCGYRLSDMVCGELKEYLPPDFDMLLVAAPVHFAGHKPENVVCLSLPLKVIDLVNTMSMILDAQSRRRRRRRQQPIVRNDKEKTVIGEAKALLMERNHMTEDQAHRYIQKCSMDSGTNMVETARMVISLNRF